MPLELRPTGLGSGIDKDRPDYTVYCGGWAIGRIYEPAAVPTVCAGVLSLDRRRSELQISWSAWKAWAKLAP